MKTSRLVHSGFAFLAAFGLLTGCLSVTSTNHIPAATLTLTVTVIPSPTGAPTDRAEPTSVPIVTETRQSDGMTMVYIPAGKFMMGSDDGEADEDPIHGVYLDAYWMDQTEITNGMYALCVESGSCKPPMKTESYTRTSYYDNKLFADYPIIHVDWNMAKAYCEWAGARLPTEAEWEKAARSDDARIYPWGKEWDVAKFRRLNFADKSNPEMTSDINVNDGYRETAPVGSYPGGKSPYGILDLAGNVWEWVADWYDPLYYRDSPLSNPTGPTQETSMRVLRGGAWVAANQNVFHTSNRNGLEPSRFSESIGFRCAR